MNERTLNLMTQAKQYAWGKETHWSANTEREALFEQKFAELIVDECAQVCWSVSELDSKGYTVSECAKAIRKHFGVEV